MEHLIARFGSPAREMLGILSLPDAPHGSAAWLLCNPFGQEAVRSKQMYRVLAERLVREGCTVMRFDYHGTGDSPGEAVDQSLGEWIADLLAADLWLRSRQTSAVDSMHWFGLRLGANLAALAAPRASRRPDHLLLWDPVLDGRQYCEFLLVRHRESISEAMHMNWTRLRRETGEPEPSLPGKVLGFDVGPALAADLAGLGPPPLAALLKEGLRIGIALDPEPLERVQLPNDPALDPIAIESKLDWSANDAYGAAIAPQQVQRVVLASIVQR